MIALCILLFFQKMEKIDAAVPLAAHDTSVKEGVLARSYFQ